MAYALTMTGGAGDPEPGRCRRTDGKKWRCSRDAVADQKYCERHVNRGRHRSRKHVETHSNRISSTKSNPTTTATKPAGATVTMSTSSQHQTKDLRTALSASCSDPPLDETSVDRDEESLSLLTPMLPFAKQQDSPKSFQETDSSHSEFGSHTLRRFIDDCPTSNTNQQYQQYNSWPELQEQTHLETTQLSISIPSLGGPLGEVLTKNCGIHTSFTKDQSKGLNLLTGPWDLDSSSRHRSSPTGVLQKTSFGSLSSSAGSSPRPETYYKSHEDLGSILVNQLSNIE